MQQNKMDDVLPEKGLQPAAIQFGNLCFGGSREELQAVLYPSCEKSYLFPPIQMPEIHPENRR